MTDDQKIDAIIEYWRKILRLEDWDIVWEWNDALGHDAESHPFPTEQRMKMFFGHCVLDYPQDELEETVGHEMLHAILAPIDEFLDPWMHSYLPPAIVPCFAELLNSRENYAIEKLIRILKKGDEA